ncbi:hypothetical protein Taro_045079, partial [Colocasia esculenta]|nr:hypothetical protein [Colocasia esculenta]
MHPSSSLQAPRGRRPRASHDLLQAEEEDHTGKNTTPRSCSEGEVHKSGEHCSRKTPSTMTPSPQPAAEGAA